MKYIFFVLPSLCSLAVYGQEIKVAKGKDTIFVGSSDTTVLIPFTIEGATTIDLYPSLRIRVHSGQAVEERDFVLRDAYDKSVKEINITKVANRVGSFHLHATGGLKEAKTMNLQTTLYDGKRAVPDIVKLVLAPNGKKPAAEEKPKPKDSVVFVRYNSINIQVYETDKEKKEVRRTRRFLGVDKLLKDTKADYLLNITPPQITQRSRLEYRVQVRTTEDEVYFAIIKLNDDYTFKDDDKLYLNGVAGAQFVRARDIFYAEEQKAGETIKKASADNPQIKFPL